MTKVTVMALGLVAAAIGLLSSLHGQAQTSQQLWSTFLGNNQGDSQPNRILIEYEEPSAEDLKPI
jgi:hypothetical protein